MIKIHYEQSITDVKLMGAGVEKGINIIDPATSERQTESAIETRSRKQQKVKGSQLIE